ncbi:MAG: AlpA family transcriptional regulator [Burkholderiaceae bacterium]|nr:AlpA family transcriptional regulator [Burkholderiaceae bacterium]
MKRTRATVHRDTDTPRVFARLPAVIQATGLGRSTIYRLVARGTFPSPVHLGPRAVGWRWSDLDQWSASRPSALVDPSPAPRARRAEAVRPQAYR